MAATIAHEGNPRSNSLAITGTLDGGATLVMVFPQGPILPFLPIGVVPLTINGPALGKYVFSKDVQNNITFVFGNNQPTPLRILNELNGAVVHEISRVAAGWVKEYSFNGVNMHGCILAQSRCSYDLNYNFSGAVTAYKPAYRFNRTFWDMLGDQQINNQEGTGYDFGNVDVTSLTLAKMLEVEGTPISGVAVMCDPESTRDEFTGLAAVYDWSTSTLYTMSYNHQPLSRFGTILSSNSATMAVTRVLQVACVRARGDGNLFTVQGVVSGSASTSASNVVSPYYGPNPVNGLINIASSASHTATADESVTWEVVTTRFDLTDVL